MQQQMKESIAKLVFLICAVMSIFLFLLITGFIFAKGLPGIFEIGVFNFLFGKTWDPRQELFGILPMILTSFISTAFAFIIGSFLGRWAAIYLAYFCSKNMYKFLKPVVELLAGIPSIVYGFFGVVVIVPIIRETFGGPGKSLLATIIVLTIMILPTIINLSENAIRAVPKSYYYGALGLGARHNEAVFKVVVPAARSGIYASYILGIGRALGETMAILLVAGNSPRMPSDLLQPVRTLTTGIAMEMSYATGLHQQALFGIGVVLFVAIMILNIILTYFTKVEV